MKHTIESARKALAAGEVSAKELVTETLKAYTATNDELNGTVEVFEEAALAAAEKVDTNDERPLAGVPLTIKDVICTTEGHTRAASKILSGFRSPFDATVITRLKEAGAIVISKSNCDEFAMGGSNEFSQYGPAKNPWDTSRVAGGSSGGPAVAVSAGHALGGLGTDTGGSTRMPANFCNIVGVRPTYGRVSRFGVVSYASSFDQVGPMTRTVKDAALLLQAIAGHDPHDATTATTTVDDYVAACGKDITGLTIGVPTEFMTDDVTPSIRAIIETALAELQSLGATIKKISLPLTYAAIPTYYLLVKAEASSNLARYDGLRFSEVVAESKDLLEHYMKVRGQNFGPEVKRSILMGTYALSAGYADAWYKQASKVRTLIRREIETAFTDVDLIAGPVNPILPFKLGSKVDDPLAMYLADLFMVPMAVAGVPAISVPAGFADEDGTKLPVGLQLVAPAWQEARMLQAAFAYEQSQSWWQETPPLA